MSGAKKSHGEDLQAVQSSGLTSSSAPGSDPHEMQARHGNSAVAQAALAGVNDRGLPGGVRSEMEAAFGRSFSDVRVSEGERVRPGQLAVTAGGTIDFAPGQLEPETPAGRFLLAHELTHVVQQQNGGGAAVLAKADGSRAPSRPDLEREADDVASCIAEGGGPVQVQGRVAPGEPVTLAFEAREHVHAAWKANQEWVQFGKFYIPWAFTVAMADLFENVDQAREIAENDPEQFEAVLSLKVAEAITHKEPGEAINEKTHKPTDTIYHPNLKEARGKIDELLMVAAVDPGQFRGMRAKSGKRKTEDDFSKRVRVAVKTRYYKLAADNIAHFLNPDRGDVNRSVLEKIARSVPRKGEKPRENAASTYHRHHERAIWDAVEAGAKHKSIDGALLFEGWAAHFLTDSFSGGHMRTVRREAAEHWDERAPLFYRNMTGYIAERVAKQLQHSWLRGVRLEDRFGLVRWVLKGKLEDFPVIGGGMALSALPQHDLDNFQGVMAVVAGKTMRLMGDTRVDQATMTQAAMAVQASRGEVEQGHKMGAEGKSFDDVVLALKKDNLYAAEHLIPKVVPDEQLGAGDKSLPWENLSAEALFKDENFRRGATRFLELKANDFASILADVPGFARSAIEETVLKEMKTDPAGMLWKILNWTPNLGVSARSVEYLREAAKSDDLGRLTSSQREPLVKDALSGRMTDDKRHLLRTLLLTAPPGEARLIIQHLGYDRLAKVLGPKFAELASELPTQ